MAGRDFFYQSGAGGGGGTVTPSGVIAMFGGAAAPTGWLLCDGTAVSRTTYANLFAALSTTYGVGDGSTTFNLPDTRGIFVRGVGTQTVSGTSYTGVLATKQADQIQGHSHKANSASSAGSFQGQFFGNNNGGDITLGNNGTTSSNQNMVTDNTNGTPRFGTETRPGNIGLNYIIKT